MNPLPEQPDFRLKSGKTLSLSELKAVFAYAQELEIQMICVESLIDQGVRIEKIPRGLLAEYLENFSNWTFPDSRANPWPDTNQALASNIDAWHYNQGFLLVRDACEEYFQAHRRELLRRVELPSGAEVLEDPDELAEARALAEAWAYQRLAAELLAEQNGAPPSREDVLRLAAELQEELERERAEKAEREMACEFPF